MNPNRRAAAALVLALLASVGMVIILMGLVVGSRVLRPGSGSAAGYLVSAVVHLAVGGSLLVAAFAALRRINRRPPG